MPFGQYPSFRFFLRMSPRIACHYYKVRGNQFPKLECKFLLRTSLSFSRGCHVQKVFKRYSRNQVVRFGPIFRTFFGTNRDCPTNYRGAAVVPYSLAGSPAWKSYSACRISSCTVIFTCRCSTGMPEQVLQQSLALPQFSLRSAHFRLFCHSRGHLGEDEVMSALRSTTRTKQTCAGRI